MSAAPSPRAGAVGHTPGPWTAWDWPSLGGGTQGVKANERIVALCDEDLALSTDERRANARLIAAAPALLAALERAVDEAGFSLSGPTDHRAAEHGEPHWVCNARAVVASARAEAGKGAK